MSALNMVDLSAMIGFSGFLIFLHTWCRSLPPERANDQGEGDHRSENDQHRRVGIAEVPAQPKGRDCNDSEVQHVARDRKGPPHQESMTGSQGSRPTGHRIHTKREHDESNGACAGAAETGRSAGGRRLHLRTHAGEERDFASKPGEQLKDWLECEGKQDIGNQVQPGGHRPCQALGLG